MAIDSIIKQTYQNWELLVIDDQSNDDTWDIINKYSLIDKRIICYRNPVKGANNARNLGIEKARGEYIAFLDDDDVSLPHRFASQVNAMITHKSRFLVSWHEVRDRGSNKLIRSEKTIFTGSAIGFPSRWMIEKSLLLEVGGFDPAMTAMQEIELSHRLATKYTFDYHDDVVSVMYFSSQSTSQGRNGNLGKIQLLQKAGHLMFPEEKAYWAFSVALWYVCKNDYGRALTYYQTSAGGIRSLMKAKPLFKCIAYLFTLIKSGAIGARVITKLITFEFPNLVKHRIIPSD